MDSGPMSEKFRVILEDLSRAAGTFHTESTTFEAIMDGSAYPAPVDGGDLAFNATLGAVLGDLVFLHSSIAAWMSDHGDKLQEARDNYQQVDQSMHELFDDLMPGR
jgi:hypothetical protein